MEKTGEVTPSYEPVIVHSEPEKSNCLEFLLSILTFSVFVILIVGMGISLSFLFIIRNNNTYIVVTPFPAEYQRWYYWGNPHANKIVKPCEFPLLLDNMQDSTPCIGTTFILKFLLRISINLLTISI